MVGEAAAVRRGELPRVELAQVREDLPCAPVQPSVFRLQDGGLVGAGEGVTEAAGKLQKAGLIRYARGRIEVLDLAGLKAHACECYALVKKEYDRLLG